MQDIHIPCRIQVLPMTRIGPASFKEISDSPAIPY